MRISIDDEDGIIAIVNAARYFGFVDPDWELQQLKQHFISEMNNNNLIVWRTNIYGGTWNIEMRERPSAEKAFRQFEKTISVTRGELYIASYTDLTMAAQFEEERIPSTVNADVRIEIANGEYNFTVRQMFDPAEYDESLSEDAVDDSSRVHFEIITLPVRINEAGPKTTAVFWWED
jgi:hypothetical protein